MTPEVKLIYHIMLNTKKYNNIYEVPNFIHEVAEKYCKLLDSDCNDIARTIISNIIKQHRIIRMWVVYILELNDGSYYTGITKNLNKRLDAHKSGKGSKYVRSRLPCRVVYICNERDRSEASKREAAIKKLSRKKKELLIKEKDSMKKITIEAKVEDKGVTFPVTPLYDQIFIKKDDASRTKSGLHLPDTVKGRAVVGVVVAVGPGLLSPYTGGYLPMQIKVGDKVLLREFSGYIIKLPNETEVFSFKEGELLGTIKD